MYWFFASLPSKYRSALHTIQLALLCKIADLKKSGYKAVFSPLLNDINILEEEGVSIESLGQNVRGTVFCVSADNLAAHGLRGFTESFRSEYVCRFCLTTRDQMQSMSVIQGDFPMRTGQSRNLCPLCFAEWYPKQSVWCNFFTLSLDLLQTSFTTFWMVLYQLLVNLKFFTLDYFNSKTCFHMNTLTKPHPIPKTCFTKGSVGGNGHENTTLLRRFLLMVGGIAKFQRGIRHGLS